MEIWKNIPGHEGYFASSFGRIKKGDRVLNQSIRVRNYLGVRVSKKTWLSHRLVLMAFWGMPPSDKPEGMHLNGDPRDNRIENLRWGSHAENMAMDRGNNHAHKGVRNPNRKLTMAAVNEIRRTYDNRTSHFWGATKLAKKFGIRNLQVQLIATRKPGGWV